jgi:hypothetical protein
VSINDLNLLPGKIVRGTYELRGEKRGDYELKGTVTVEIYCAANPAVHAFNLLVVAASNVLRRPVFMGSSVNDLCSAVGSFGFGGAFVPMRMVTEKARGGAHDDAHYKALGEHHDEDIK